MSPLEEERDDLLRRLRELDEEYEAGDLDETDYRNLREDYTARAAAVIRQLHDEGSSPAGAPVTSGGSSRRKAPAARPRRSARVRVVAALALLAVAAGGTGFALAGSSGERTAMDEATGSLPQGSVDRITRANILVTEGKILEAIRVYDDLLKDDPENPVALAQRGWLLSRVDPSLVDRGLENIDRAIAIDPRYPEAHFFRGMILWQAKGDPVQGAESFQRAIDAKPPPGALATIEEVKARALADAAAPTTTP